MRTLEVSGPCCLGGFYRSLLHRLGFCIESLLWGVPVEGFPGSFVEFFLDLGEPFAAMLIEVGALWKVPAQ